MQARLVDALFAITTQLVEDSDGASVLAQITRSCVDLLGASAAGIILADPRGGLAVLTASDEESRLVELLQQQLDEGPCVESIKTGKTVEVPDLAVEPERWPRFSASVAASDYHAILSVPVLLQGRPIGGLNVLFAETTSFSEYQRRLGSVFAALAALHLSREDGEHRKARAVEQSLSLLNDRVRVEHALGMVAGARGVSIDTARVVLERYARSHALPLGEVAHRLTSRQLDLGTLDVEGA
ncbi:GAF domain-containing protein [Rhodococcus chondri]|uniref:GAF domain-containing protein n=1 Tax=Rhodococcus chondri TaxID=3065941 RepID=A0ABU7JU03_9NOCA|nr:GAF domain-containing protein [Rhodococcus sp. CC-R104]MEE2033399.1 GAF domain-containing protein [Rhodococcus sp. CC-R104]